VGLLNDISLMDEDDAAHAGLERGAVDTFAGVDAKDFEDAGIVYLGGSGLVLQFPDGTEFQLEIKQTR
jgi:hypothetical protein